MGLVLKTVEGLLRNVALVEGRIEMISNLAERTARRAAELYVLLIVVGSVPFGNVGRYGDRRRADLVRQGVLLEPGEGL